MQLWGEKKYLNLLLIFMLLKLSEFNILNFQNFK